MAVDSIIIFIPENLKSVAPNKTGLCIFEGSTTAELKNTTVTEYEG